MEPAQAQQNQPVPADSLRRNQVTAREVMRLENGRVNPFAISKPHSQSYLEGLARLPGCQGEARQKFLDTYHAGQVIIVVSKFTLFDEVISATSLARRVAQELDVDLDDEVGYAVRFDNTSNDRTRLKFRMDDLLPPGLHSDGELSRYACVMVDESLERTKSIDLLLALLKQYFPGSNVFHAQGQACPVQIQYLRESMPEYRKAMIETVAHVAQTKPEGSILVFMTSVQKIEETCGLIRKKVPGLQVSPLYSSLSRAQMEGVMDTNTGRKCIVSTNVAEAT
ncbi:hypothetical protein CEP54_002469 [Fusarium duplospermum]|uniref:Helicase C-terminal domain-containing protein n=1 Tax=Fusarium duplospermum TaxID=1325734 RepID=A0A428QV08_9HYPO|nr:hypothetical protein CEP54_002469 [Fusarium duplospermum]